MLRVLYKAFAPRRIKNYLSLHKLLIENYISPRLGHLPEGKKILVLAPHTDDEVIGCGGTLHKHFLAGAEITVVYMTDGRKGDPLLFNQKIPAKEKNKIERELIKQRREEAYRAARIIGIRHLIFLDHPDTELRLNKETIFEMFNILRNTKPDLVYLPFLTDRHQDHIETNKIFIAAIKKGTFNFKCLGYEVWNPLYPNYMVEIKDTINIKIKALREYKSQLMHNNYVKAILGLNRYRSIFHLGGNSYVEAFFLATLEQYSYLYKISYE